MNITMLSSLVIFIILCFMYNKSNVEESKKIYMFFLGFNFALFLVGIMLMVFNLGS